MTIQAQRDALLDYRHGMYRHEVSGAATKPSRPPSRSSAESSTAGGGRNIAQTSLPQNPLSTHLGNGLVESLLEGPLPQPPLANGFNTGVQPFQLDSQNDHLFGPGNNDFDGLFQQLLSQDLTDFSMPLFWQHQQ